jgi:cytochrome c oxidase assembly protein subunit 11
MRLLAALHRDNRQLFGKLAVIVVLMFGFSYSLVYFYDAICKALGINVLSLAEKQTALAEKGVANGNGQVDFSREITVEFDTNARGPWDFKPAVRHLTVHPGELTQVMYEFKNVQDRTMAAQAIPSYAPMQAGAHFNKLECFCFNEYTLKPGESKQWPVVFVIDPRLPKDVKTITLSYTFFEVAGKGGVKLGQAPQAQGGAL